MGFTDRLAGGNRSLMARFGDHEAVVGAERVPVLYDAPFKGEELYEGQVNTTAPAVTMEDADVARLRLEYGSRLTVMKGAVPIGAFEVIEVTPDGLGLTRLTLTKD